VSCFDTPFSVSSMVVREQPDVVVFDMMMPGLSGGTLAEIIGRLDLPTAPKLVMWSAMPDHVLAEESARLGIPCLSKGERPSALVEVIERLMSAKDPTP